VRSATLHLCALVASLAWCLASAACARGGSGAPDAAASANEAGAPGPGAGATSPGAAGTSPGASTTSSALAARRAEDRRRAADVTPEMRTSHDVVVRRQSARALARIADAPSAEALAAHLSDEDAETVAWAAYGLAHACKGREEAHVKMLAARAASLDATEAGARSAARGAAEIDPRTAIARAIGRCGASPLGEQILVSLARAGGTWLEPSLLGLGDLATRRKQLGAEAMTTLLDLATARAEHPPADAAFYALSRAEPGEAFRKRVVDTASASLVRVSPYRLLAIKALGRVGHELGKEAAPVLAKIVEDPKAFDAAERAEAARALGSLDAAGQAAAAGALARVMPDTKDPVAIAALVGPESHVLEALVAALGAEPPRRAEPLLVALSVVTAPSDPAPPLARRLATLRCAAALGLSRGASDAEVLRKCDHETSEISQRARLTSLLRRPLVGDRAKAFRALARSEHLRIREAAVEAIAQHPELGDVAASVLAEGLSSGKAGLVAASAEVVVMHPERVMVLAESEKKAALDARAPPPTASPAQETSREVARALNDALDVAWPPDRFETRIALLEAAAAVHLPRAKAVLGAACTDPSGVVRERASKALRTLGESVAPCEAPPRELDPAPELDAPRTAPVKVVFTTDASLSLTVVLEPELSPVTATRIATLVKAGFYRGVVVHRVVPGFVAQLGDPEGDGYGGSGRSLRCETSPVPFGRLDVGMALSGRDTGSSQIFVTLTRTPHLDGEYTRVGRAEGDWWAVAQGDVIAEAKLVE